MTEVTALKRKRGTVKGKLTRFETLLDDARRYELSTLRSRMRDAETLLSAFEKIQDELDEVEGMEEDNLAERIKFEDDYHRCMGRAAGLLERSSSGVSTVGHHAEPTIKLPTINLPTFDGNFEHWLQFHDSFKSLIHDNAALSDSQRFHYLRSSLRDVAAEVIRSLEVSAANYVVAWDLLKKRFNQTHLMVSSHLQAILDLAPISGDIGTSLRQMLDNVQRHTRALQTLQANTWDTLLIHIVMNKVDAQTRREWRGFVKDTEAPNNDLLVDFLEDRCAIMYSGSPVKPALRPKVAMSARTDGRPKSSFVTCAVVKTLKCALCHESHNLYQCSRFKELSAQSRKDEVARLGVCVNCLREHQGRACTFSRCKVCDKFHNTLLHVNKPQQAPAKHDNPGAESSVGQPPRPATQDASMGGNLVSLTQYKTDTQQQILLSTALVLIRDANGNSHQCRALLDSGSQLNLITRDLSRKLGLRTSQISMPIVGIENTITNVSERLPIEVHSRFNGYQVNLWFEVVDCIVNRYPVSRPYSLKLPENLTLADPTYDRPGKIDLIIGAEIFWELTCAGQIDLGKGQPRLQKTKLGWIVGGRMAANPERKAAPFCGYISNEDLDKQLCRFWSIEDDVAHTFLSDDERQCEESFVATHNRDSTGRFSVSLPLRAAPTVLGNSKDAAVKRFYSLERKFRKFPELQQQYTDFVREYALLGHMTEITDVNRLEEVGYYIPHHAVIKESSSTTKLRVVFDASSKTTTNTSLNDILRVGPTIQQDLLSILLRFRQHIYVVSADIEKMYRQVNVVDRDRTLQRIVWRDTPDEPLRVFFLNTVTYGLASSPYLAIRCLHQLAQDNEDRYPGASKVIKTDFYVDDLLSGADEIEDVKRIKSEVSDILQSSGFNLRKWMANNASLTDVSDAGSIKAVHDADDETKILGLFWDPKRDEFRFRINPSRQSTRPTKRIILSTIAQIFDPLGLLGPVIVKAKVMLQQLWLLKIGWNESIPLQFHTSWLRYIEELPHISTIRIPRGVRDISTAAELHGFCDASEAAYGACVYLRSLTNGTWTTNLLCARSRVAPIKNISLPRLELCGALLLARLDRKVRQALTVSISGTVYWCDSTIALAWIAGEPCQWKTFIANRVAEVQRLTDRDRWRHVRSEDNPADVISRGTEPQHLEELSIWWKGPVWLSLNEDQWPELPRNTTEEIPEARVTLVAVHTAETDFAIVDRFSSLSRLKRITAYCLRFGKNALNKSIKVIGSLTIDELEDAMIRLIKLTQQKEWSSDMTKLRQERELPVSSQLVSLSPFLDREGLIRVGGRLANSNLGYDQRHPILLPSRHALTRLIIRHEHYKALHAGTQALLALIRQKYWIVSGKTAIKSVLRHCIICFKSRPKTLNQLMGNLPASRVVPSRPFAKCGVDYAGPFSIKISRNKTGKAYLCLFVCFATKAIHLEVASDLSTDSFLNAFKRFISRRGKPTEMYSDNGTNFVGAQNEMREFGKFLKNDITQGLVRAFCTEESILWHFIPARSPHFGGLWEAGVRSVKTHTRKIIGNDSLSLDELSTVFTLVEACVNSRPLSPLSDDPADLAPLTPGHFLIGPPLVALPQKDLLDVPLNRLSRYQHLTRLQQHFWARWSSEYLTHLQQRYKWNRAFDYTHLHGALVILKEDNLMPTQWRMGRILKLHPGKDGLIRVATINIKGGTVQRAVGKLCVLPIES